MNQLIIIGYRDRTGAPQASDCARALAVEFAIGDDAIATVVCGAGGACETHTSYDPDKVGDQWGLFWNILVSSAVLGAEPHNRRDARPERDCEAVDAALALQLRLILEPETSALLLAVPHELCDVAIQRLSPFGGTVLTWSHRRRARMPRPNPAREAVAPPSPSPSPDRGDSELPTAS